MKQVVAIILLLLGVTLSMGSANAQTRPIHSLQSIHEDARAFLALPEHEQENRAQRARVITQRWLKVYKGSENGQRPEWTISQALTRVLSYHLTSVGTNLFNILPEPMNDFQDAVRVDPTFLEAHVALARIYYETGQRSSTVIHAEFVRQYVHLGREESSDSDFLAAQWLAYESLYPLAWAYRELGAWEEGLAVIVEAERFLRSRGLGESTRLNLIKGLLLAGAGQGSEALRVAQNVRPSFMSQKRVERKVWIPYRRISIYGQDWIRSQVFLREGQYHLAISGSHKTQLEYRKVWSQLPYYKQYWNDMGLIFELRNEPTEAARWYAQMKAPRFDWGMFFDRGRERRTTPLIAGLPSAQVIYFQTENQDYLWGSPFAYVVDQYRRLEGIPDLHGEEAYLSHLRIMEMLRSLEARNIRPDFCQALRGRIAYLYGDLSLAELELSTALERFAEMGISDSGTRGILGLVKYGLGKDEEARVFLAEAHNDAVALQGLGVILARKGEFSRALSMMNRALELEPRSMAAWFNRGMLHYVHGHHEKARDDFRRAHRLDSTNADIRKWLEICETLCMEPISGMEFFRRGQAFMGIQEYVRARDDFLKAYEMEPERSQEIAPWLQRIPAHFRFSQAE